MVFSNEEIVIVKYFWIKYKYDATKSIGDHPGYKWKVNGAKKLLKKVEETSDIAKKRFSWPKSVRTEENIRLVKEMILS